MAKRRSKPFGHVQVILQGCRCTTSTTRMRVILFLACLLPMVRHGGAESLRVPKGNSNVYERDLTRLSNDYDCETSSTANPLPCLKKGSHSAHATSANGKGASKKSSKRHLHCPPGSKGKGSGKGSGSKDCISTTSSSSPSPAASPTSAGITETPDVGVPTLSPLPTTAGSNNTPSASSAPTTTSKPAVVVPTAGGEDGPTSAPNNVATDAPSLNMGAVPTVGPTEEPSLVESGPTVVSTPTSQPSEGAPSTETVTPTSETTTVPSSAVAGQPTIDSTPTVSPVASTSQPSVATPSAVTSGPTAGSTTAPSSAIAGQPTIASVPTVSPVASPSQPSVATPSAVTSGPTVDSTTEPSSAVAGQPTIASVPTVSPVASTSQPSVATTPSNETVTPTTEATLAPSSAVAGQPTIASVPTVSPGASTSQPSVATTPSNETVTPTTEATLAPSSAVAGQPTTASAPTVSPVASTSQPSIATPSAVTTAPSAFGSQPTIDETPTTAPVAPTSQPSASPSAQVIDPISPFSITYEGVDGAVSETEFDNAANLTMNHLEEWLQLALSFEGAVIDDFRWTDVERTTNPAEIGYDVEVVFAVDSPFLPSEALLNDFIKRGFAPENVETLLLDLQGLPDDDPFSQVTDANYTAQVNVVSESNEQSIVDDNAQSFGSLMENGAGIAAGVGVLVLALGFLVTGRRGGNRWWKHLNQKGSPQCSKSDTANHMCSSSNLYDSEDDGFLIESQRFVANRGKADPMEIEFHTISRRYEDHLGDPLFDSPFTSWGASHSNRI